VGEVRPIGADCVGEVRPIGAEGCRVMHRPQREGERYPGDTFLPCLLGAVVGAER